MSTLTDSGVIGRNTCANPISSFFLCINAPLHSYPNLRGDRFWCTLWPTTPFHITCMLYLVIRGGHRPTADSTSLIVHVPLSFSLAKTRKSKKERDNIKPQVCVCGGDPYQRVLQKNWGGRYLDALKKKKNLIFLLKKAALQSAGGGSGYALTRLPTGPPFASYLHTPFGYKKIISFFQTVRDANIRSTVRDLPHLCFVFLNKNSLVMIWRKIYSCLNPPCRCGSLFLYFSCVGCDPDDLSCTMVGV